MPILNASLDSFIKPYNEQPRGVRGIPAEAVVAILTRQNGMGIDNPKGYKQPECFVECCEPVAGDFYALLAFEGPVDDRGNTINLPPENDVDFNVSILFLGRAIAGYTIPETTFNTADFNIRPRLPLDPESSPVLPVPTVFTLPETVVPIGTGELTEDNFAVFIPIGTQTFQWPGDREPRAFIDFEYDLPPGSLVSLDGRTNLISPQPTGVFYWNPPAP
jgi:hypothetical protein